MAESFDEHLASLFQGVIREYKNLEERLQDPEVFKNRGEYRRLAKRHGELHAWVRAYREWEEQRRRLQETREMTRDETDPEMLAYLEEEIALLERQVKEKRRELLNRWVPADPRDERNVILEIRAGTGGHEAALFAADLFRMYLRYGEKRGWRIHVLDAHSTDLGGYREIVLLVEGRGAFSRLKYESGIHRVQRVPVTETGGRIHTSAVTVAVLPEVEDVEITLRDEELRMDVFSSSGPGGQHVNKSMTAVRITHLPTGIVVVCQDERSLGQNRRKALRVLRSRLHDYFRRRQAQDLDAARKAQVGRGDRSEKIRTYNFPQNRVTDHRIGLTLYRLEDILNGDLDPLVEALVRHDRDTQFKAMGF